MGAIPKTGSSQGLATAASGLADPTQLCDSQPRDEEQSMTEQSAAEASQPSGGNGAQAAIGQVVQSSNVTAVPAPALAVVATPNKYFASIAPGPQSPLPDSFVQTVHDLEASLGIPLWLYLQDQDGDAKFDDVNEDVRKAFWASRSEMEPNKPIALLIDSPGGYSKSAYQTAMLIRRRCGEFTAVIPRYAKSAATLLSLGASKLILNTDAELGPLDVQIFDAEREEWASALDEVQTVERLQASSLSLLDQTTMFLLSRTGKKVDTVIPQVLKFVSDMMRPMFENIDVVHFTQRARTLKVTEDYAIRLLRPAYSRDEAERIGRRLVSAYSDHGFIIDAEEASDFGGPEVQAKIKTIAPTSDQAALMDSLMPLLGQQTILGRLQEVQTP